MYLNELFDSTKFADAAFSFGRFNPPHQGHVKVWNTVANSGKNWFVCTNPQTIGLKNPLPFKVKSAWMIAIDPELKNHILPETSIITALCTIYKKLGSRDNLTIAYITDDDDWKWSGNVLNKYNGHESSHGYYKFSKIIHVSSPRISSATDLRTAAINGNKIEFYQAAGIDPDLMVNNEYYYETVVRYLKPYTTKNTEVTDSIDGGSPESLKRGIGNASYVSQKPKEFESKMRASEILKDGMLPKSAFAGTEPPWNYKLGTAGQLRNQKRGARAGDLVGGGESVGNNWHKRSLEKVVQDILDYIGPSPSDSAIMDAAKEEAKLSGLDPQKVFDAVYDKIKGTVIETKQRLDAKCWKGYQKQGTKKKGNTKVNNCVKIGEDWERKMSQIISLLEEKIDEDVSLARNRNYGQQSSYGPCNIFVSNEKFKGQYFIAVAEHPRTNSALFKTQGNTKEEAINKLHAEIDAAMEKHTKAVGYSVIDFNRDFVIKILDSSSENFYAKIVPGPQLIIAGSELSNYPEYALNDGFKKSQIRIMLSTEGSTPFPSIQLKPLETEEAGLIANGRYIIGNEQTDRDGNRIFDLTFDSTVIDKNEKVRMGVPALTVGTKR